MGTKNVKEIDFPFIKKLETLGYYQHTIDKASLAGRGLDLNLTNPLTGRPMTGSSSGTAINVFLNINDIGIGTDGGGSVLAPAMSLNLYGCIHPDLGNLEKKETKISTDGISFSPSLGIITKNLTHISRLLAELLPVERSRKTMKIALDSECLDLKDNLSQLDSTIVLTEFHNKYELSRSDLIIKLADLLNEYDVVISKEGPIDLEGFGESVFGHFDEQTQKMQRQANKGFLRVVNMVGGVGLTIPIQELSTGYLLICRNTSTSIEKLLQIARLLETKEDYLVKSYFGDLNNYFENGV